jgi:hypothetical protein
VPTGSKEHGALHRVEGDTPSLTGSCFTGGSASFYDGVGGGVSVTGNQSGVQGVVSVGVGAGGAARAGGTYGASYGKAVPIC